MIPLTFNVLSLRLSCNVGAVEASRNVDMACKLKIFLLVCDFDGPYSSLTFHINVSQNSTWLQNKSLYRMCYMEWSGILEFCIATGIIRRHCLRDRNINVLYCVWDTKALFIRKPPDIILDTSTCNEQFMTTVPKIYVFFEGLFLSHNSSKSNQKFLMTFIVHVFYSALCNATRGRVSLRRRALISNLKAGDENSFHKRLKISQPFF